MAPGPIVPVNASTTTKILITLSAVLLAIGGLTWPTGVSTSIGEYAVAAGTLLGSIAGIVHAIWDHSP
jgi:hypothetical protein